MSYELTSRQTEAFELLDSDDCVDLCYGGAKGGGKSWFFCIWCFKYAADFHNFYKLTPKKSIPHIGWMGRKQATDFTSTTLQTWQDIIDIQYYRICSATDRHPKHILLFDTVAIDFGGLDHREDINKFNSAEYGFIAIDQAEETTRDEVSFLRASRRLKFRNKPLRYKGLFTANPAQCWLKEDFILNPRPGCKFVQALPSDNPHLPNTYIETLRESFGHRPELLEAYLYGSWDSLEGADQVIKDLWIRDAQTRHLPFLSKRPRVACDPARFGDDETVIFYGETTDVMEQKIRGQSSVVQTAKDCIELSHAHGDCPIIVEEDGIGGGVIDNLVDMGHSPLVYNASSPARNRDRYGNTRSESWSGMAKMFSEGMVEFKNECMTQRDLSTLINQLTTPRYKFRSGKTYIECKDDIKSRLNTSPDRADCYNIFIWGYDKVPSIEEDILGETQVEENNSYTWETVL